MQGTVPMQGGRTHRRRLAVGAILLATLSLLFALVLVLSAPAEAAVPISAQGPDGAAVDAPFFFHGQGTLAVYDENSGLVSEPPAYAYDPIVPGFVANYRGGVWPPAGGPSYNFAACQAALGCNGGVGPCGSVALQWPQHTLQPETEPAKKEFGCYVLDQGPNNSDGALEVVVAPTIQVGGETLVFDHWSAPPSAVAETEPTRCRIGDLGEQAMPWLGGGVNPPGSGFAQGPAYAASYNVGWELGGSMVAHYARRSPDTTAPLINVESPFDCQFIKAGTEVEAHFHCDDMGGSGVKSCSASGDLAGAKLDTSTEGGHSFTVTATDNNGNTRTRTIRWFVDGKAPPVEFEANPPAPTGKHGWYNIAQLGENATVQVKVKSTGDAGVGPAAIPCKASSEGTFEGPWSYEGLAGWTYVLPPNGDPNANPLSWGRFYTEGAKQFNTNTNWFITTPVRPFETRRLSCYSIDTLRNTTPAVSGEWKVATSPPGATYFSWPVPVSPNPYGPDRAHDCWGISSKEAVKSPMTVTAYRPSYIRWFSAGSPIGMEGPTEGLIPRDTTPTANPGELRTVQGPTVEDVAGNRSAPGEVCEYYVGPPKVTEVSAGVACPPGSFTLGVAATCKVTLRDKDEEAPVSPTGRPTVTVTGRGSTPTACDLTGTGGAATCTFTYTPTASLTGRTITVSYPGDVNHDPAQATLELPVTRRATTTAFSCASATVPPGGHTTCTATVRDVSPAPASTPTGTVAFSGGKGFEPASCTLLPDGRPAEASCTTTFTAPTGIGGRSYYARYGGDARHATSTGTTVILTGS